MTVRVLATLVLAGLLVAGCPGSGGLAVPEIPGVTGSRMSDSEHITAVLNEVHSAMESRRVYKVLAHVSRNYRDSEGRNYEALQGYLGRFFREYRDIRITRTRPRIVVQGNIAQAVETFATRARPTNPAGGRDLNLQGKVTVYLEKTGGQWKIVEWGALQ